MYCLYFLRHLHILIIFVSFMQHKLKHLLRTKIVANKKIYFLCYEKSVFTFTLLSYSFITFRMWNTKSVLMNYNAFWKMEFYDICVNVIVMWLPSEQILHTINTWWKDICWCMRNYVFKWSIIYQFNATNIKNLSNPFF